jgi:DNA-binding NarL/FixJ family response regulator
MDDRIVSVLIADSRAHTRSAMRLLLAQEQDIAVVGEAAGMDAAVATIAACRPDVVLLGWELMERNDVSALDDLWAVSSTSFVIALSGQSEARHEALAAGADAFVSKGDPPEKLLAAVRDCRHDPKDT